MHIWYLKLWYRERWWGIKFLSFRGQLIVITLERFRNRLKFSVYLFISTFQLKDRSWCIIIFIISLAWCSQYITIRVELLGHLLIFSFLLNSLLRYDRWRRDGFLSFFIGLCFVFYFFVTLNLIRWLSLIYFLAHHSYALIFNNFFTFLRIGAVEDWLIIIHHSRWPLKIGKLHLINFDLLWLRYFRIWWSFLWRILLLLIVMLRNLILRYRWWYWQSLLKVFRLLFPFHIVVRIRISTPIGFWIALSTHRQRSLTPSSNLPYLFNVVVQERIEKGICDGATFVWIIIIKKFSLRTSIFWAWHYFAIVFLMLILTVNDQAQGQKVEKKEGQKTTKRRSIIWLNR